MTATERTETLRKFFNTFKSNGLQGLFLDNARRVSEPLATKMLKQMGLNEDISTPFKVFENTCGVGVVAPILQQIIKPDVLKRSRILSGDSSDQMVEVTQQRSESEGWVNTEVRKVDAQVCVFPGNRPLRDGIELTWNRKPDWRTAPSLMSQPTLAFTLCPTLKQL